MFAGKTVLVTGHTGFKGSWLCEWLLMLGARVVGYALDPPTQPAHFDELDLGARLEADIRGDVRALADLRQVVERWTPQFIFHLAAQPLVRRSFEEPLWTVETNVLGTANLLEAVRLAGNDCVVVLVTTDKVYENQEWNHAYREDDSLGGYDVYSASKASAELLISAYRRSFFDVPEGAGGRPRVAVASARGGNVIGGGDWAKDRIVPDCVRHLVRDEPIPVRAAQATRPWQHVLELLGGYLMLAAQIESSRQEGDLERLASLCSAFNFGPLLSSNRSVQELVEEILQHWPGQWREIPTTGRRHEAGKLHLAIDKSWHILGWKPKWDFSRTILHTVEWYHAFYRAGKRRAETTRRLTRDQIRSFVADA